MRPSFMIINKVVKSKSFKIIFKVVSVILFLFILRNIIVKTEYSIQIKDFLQAKKLLLLFGVLFLYLKYITLSYRVYYLSTAKEYNYSLSQFIRFEFKLSFYELIIPIPDYEDIARYLFLRKMGIKKVKTLSILFYNRIVGFFALSCFFIFLFSYVKSFLTDKIGEEKIFYLFASIFIIFGLFILFVLVISFDSRGIYAKKYKKYKRLLRYSMITPNKLFIGFCMGVLQFIFWGVSIYFITESYNYHINLYVLFALIPLMTISFLLPLSYQGIGIPEATLILFLNYTSPDLNVLLIAITHFIVYISVSFIGLILILLNKD